MNAAVDPIVLSVLLAIAGAFQQGLEHLQKREYDPAIAALTEVCEQDIPGNVLRHLALYHRALAYQGKGETPAALADLTKLLQEDLEPSLEGPALALYRHLGGKEEVLLPKRPPPEVWQAFCVAVRTGKLEEALTLCTQSFRELYAIDQQRYTRQWTNFVTQDIGEYTVLGYRIDTKGGQTNSLLVVENPRWQLYRVDLVRRGRFWLIGNLEVLQAATDPDINWARLAKLGRLLALHADRRDRAFPETLDQLVETGSAQPPDLVWQSFAGGKPQPFWYRSGLQHDPQGTTLVAAAPEAAGEQRLVLDNAGRVALLSEETFRQLVRDQGWAPPGLLKPDELTAAQAAQIEGCIRQLAAEDFTARAEAKRQLRELGDTARSFLERHRDDADPEVRLTIRELLDPAPPRIRQRPPAESLDW